MWDLISLIRNQTQSPALEAQNLNQWTTGEDPGKVTLTPGVWFFPHQAIVCGHQLGVVRFYSGLTLTGVCADPTGYRLSPLRPSPSQMLIQAACPQVTRTPV